MKYTCTTLAIAISFFSCYAQRNTTAEKYKLYANTLQNEYSFSKDSLRKSLQLIKSAISIDGNDIYMYYIKSGIESRLGLYDSSLSDINHVIKDSPEMYSAYMVKGTLLWKLGEKDSANAVFKDVLSLYEMSKESKTNDYKNMPFHGLLYLLVGEKEKGIAIYEKWQKAFPDDKTIPFFHNYFYNFNKEDYLKRQIPDVKAY